MNKHRLISSILFASLILTMNCSTYYRAINDRLVERLDSQIRSGDYKRIYDESSPRAKTFKYSEDEFISRMKTIVERMRAVDESLELQKHKGTSPYADEGAFPPSSYDYRYIEKNGQKIGINISVDSGVGTSRLLDFCIYTEKDGENENPPSDGLCVSDASKS
jgi:hypothetical protein